MGCCQSGKEFEVQETVNAPYKNSKFSMGRLADLKEQWDLSSKVLGEGAFGKVYLGTNKKDPS
jgi:hypothetical protein